VKTPKLSIIVPIYNVAPYLPRCLDSILRQTYSDFELLLVNDGSTDHSGKIADQYAKKNQRVSVIHQNNRGVSAARNAALKIAKGNYIGFVDPDDYIEEDMFQQLIQYLEYYDADIACCNFDSFDENNRYTEHRVSGVSPVMDRDTFTGHIFDAPRTVGGSNWNKVFLKDKIKRFYDESLRICEDNLFLVEYCMNIKKACFINQSCYHIYQREDSAIRKKPEKVVEGLRVRKKIVELAENISSSVQKKAEKDYLDSCLLLYKQFEKTSEKYAGEARQQLNEYVHANFWRVLSNKEIYWKSKVLYFLEVFGLNKVRKVLWEKA
jgi:glycosyltransferase involved in cell wall biosynthesis